MNPCFSNKFPLTTLSVQVCESLGQKNNIPEVFLTRKAKKKNCVSKYFNNLLPLIFAACSTVAGHISPVPGGVGPLTVAMLMKNTVAATKAQLGLL